MSSERLQRQIERLLDEAEEAITQRDWAAVRQHAQDVVAIEPENQEGHAFLAAAERALGTSHSDLTSIHLQSEPPATEQITPPAAATEAERRRITVMFCDLQSSTALSQQLDPEDLRDVIRSYQEVCSEAVSRFEGHIAKYLGDGLLVYFGYPQAHEDDPQRAVRGGLAILSGMKTLNERLREEKQLELTVRIGVHTGLVVAGEMGGGDTVESMAIVGDTPNIAARLQETATSNSLVVSGITADLIQGFFVCESLGSHQLKGISQAMELYAVLSESGAQTRFEVATVHHTPLVGREQELGLLLDRWEQAEEGLGQVVLLSGEAGIGKSRLIDTLTERLKEKPRTHRRLRCSAYHRNSALHPVLEYLEAWLEFGREDSAEERLSKLESALAKIALPLPETVPLLSGILSLPLSGRFPALVMSPEVQRERTHELLVALLLDTTGGQPAFLVVEDLHWADPSTLAMLGVLVDQIPTADVMSLLSFRPEFTPPWTTRAYLTPVTLNRLTRRLAGEMVDRLTGGKPLPEEVFNQVASKSDGVPLFVEELTRMVIESDLLRELDDNYELTGSLPSLAIPSTLQDSLTARLDQLADEREVAQIASVFGREFTYELIQAVSPLEEETLKNQLRQLVDSEFLYQRGLPPKATYVFKHALMQDAAYNSLLISRRQQFHHRTAQVLEEQFAGTVESQPELLAHHFAEAGLAERAVNYWLMAGERALATFAHEEAITHFERGLVSRGIVLFGAEVAPDEETAALLFGLAQAKSATVERYQLEETFAILKRAFEFYAEVGNVIQAVSVAGFPIATSGTRISGVTELIVRALALVPSASHEAGRLLSHYGGIGGGLDYDGAQQALEQAVIIARRERDLPLEMQTLSYAGIVHGQYLHWQDSLDNTRRAIELESGDETPLSRVSRRWWMAASLLRTGRLEEAHSFTEALLDLSERRTTSQISAGNSLEMVTYASVLEGDWKASREYIDRGLQLSPLNPQLIMPRILLEYETGQSVQGEVYLERLLEAVRRAGPDQFFASGRASMTIAQAARITGVPDRFNEAEAAAQSVLSAPSVTPIFAINAQATLALLAVQRGDRSAAEAPYQFLQGHRNTMVWMVSSVDRLLGLLSHTMGNSDQAVNDFEDALAFCRKAGYRPELAWICCDYADTYLQRGGDGDGAKAMSLLEESLAISCELGMHPLMERVLSRREFLGA